MSGALRGHQRRRGVVSAQEGDSTPSHEDDGCRRSPRTSHARRAAWGRELEALLAIRGTIILQIDSAGLIRRLQVHEPRQARSLTSILIGRALPDVFDTEICSLLAAAGRQSSLLKRTEEFGCSFRVSGKDQWFSVAVRNVEAKRPGSSLHVVVQHASKRARMQVRLRPTSIGVDRAIESAQFGEWEADLRSGCFTYSERLLRMLGARQDKTVVRKFLWEVIRRWYEAVPGADKSASNEILQQDIEISCPSGAPLILCARTAALAEKEGLPLRFAGIVQDVTATKAMDGLVQKQDALLAAAEQVASLGRWELDVRTGKVIWSNRLFDLLGIPASGDANEREYWNNLHPEDGVRIRGILAHAIRNSGDCAYLARYRTPVGEWRVHETRVLPIRSSTGAITHLVGVVRDVSEQTRVEEELHHLTQRLMRARDEERRYMARELHDSAGQSLAALKMSLGNLRESLSKRNARCLSLLESCVQLTDDVVREVRTVSYLMHPPLLDEAGLASAMRWYARGFSERSKIEVIVDVPEDFGRLPQEVEITVFRLVQEALTNVHRYSGSRTARIHLAREDGHIRVEVIDTGCGLARPIRPNSADAAGVGIAGMRERVHELNGAFEVETAPGRGTTVRALLPYLGTVVRPGTLSHE